MSVTQSQLDVCNEALARLKNLVGITSFDKNSTDPATRICSLTFDQCRKSIIAAVDWNFSRKELIIEPASTCSVPPDNLRILAAVDSEGAKIKFRVVGQEVVFLSNGEYPCKIVYSADIEDISLWSPIAREALIHMVAKEVAQSVTGLQGAWQKHSEELKQVIKEARTANAREARRDTYLTGGSSGDYVNVMLGGYHGN